jgi:ketosteroid isomerase-like protein
MSRENVEVVVGVYEAVARRDTAAVLALYDAEVEFDASRYPSVGLVGGDVYRGHEGLRNWFREWNESWEAYWDEVEELIDAGDHVISVVKRRGRGRVSGVEVEWQYVGLWTIRDAKVMRVAWFSSREEALEAVALRE